VHGSSMVGKYIKDSEIINAAFTSKYINLGTSGSIDEIGKGGIRKAGRYLSIIFKVIYFVAFFRPNLCYIGITAVGSGFYKDSIVALIVRLFGIKRVYHFHNKGVKTNQSRTFDNFLYKLVFKKCSAILLSKHLYQDIEKYIPLQSVFICPNGIPQFTTLPEKPANLINDYLPEILFLSNLMVSKGVWVLLNACKILLDKNYMFNCVLIGGEGDIDAKQFNEKVNKLGIQKHITYAGKKYDIEKHNAFSKAEIFVLPTNNDTFGLVNLEAMQHSLPVISTYEGGIPDIVEDSVTGFLIPKNDPIALADKLELLINNPDLRKQMGQAGRKRYEEKFTLEIFENNLKNILAEIIEKNNAK